MTRNARIANVVFAALPLMMLAAAVFCTLAIGHGASTWWRLPFRAVCHGIPERCLTIGGVAMPICARCTGIYLGMLAALAAFAALRVLQRFVVPTALAIALLLPVLLDGGTQAIGLRHSTNALRVVTGLLAGCTVLWAMSRVDRVDGAGMAAEGLSARVWQEDRQP